MTDHPKGPKGVAPDMVLVVLDEVRPQPAEPPDFPNVQARFLEPDWKVWHAGRWHTITKTQRSTSGLIVRTDEQTGEGMFGPLWRTFIIAPDLLVGGEPPAA